VRESVAERPTPRCVTVLSETLWVSDAVRLWAKLLTIESATENASENARARTMLLAVLSLVVKLSVVERPTPRCIDSVKD
jgi:hypothetical protein